MDLDGSVMIRDNVLFVHLSCGIFFFEKMCYAVKAKKIMTIS